MNSFVDTLEFEFSIRPFTDEELTHYIIEFLGKATLWDDEIGEAKQVGLIRGHRIDFAQARFDGLDSQKLVDSISPDISDFMTTVFPGGECYLSDKDPDNVCPKKKCSGLIYIDEIRVEPEYRNRGTGAELLRRMSEMIDLEACMIGLKAFPLSDNYGATRDPEEIRRVKRFYEKLDFIHAGADFMIKDASYCGVMKKRRLLQGTQSIQPLK